MTFFEAEACCAWAGGRLPREQEWEAAARGLEGCKYPWCGDWEDGICNTAEAGLGVSSPVGLFPHSRQAVLGLEDLAGNVWEWCATIDDDADSAAPANSPGARRVVRGGSWYFTRSGAPCAVRESAPANYRSGYRGFRVVCSSPSNAG